MRSSSSWFTYPTQHFDVDLERNNPRILLIAIYRNPRKVLPILLLLFLFLCALVTTVGIIKRGNAISSSSSSFAGGGYDDTKLVHSEIYVESCGLVTDVCRLKYIAVSSNDLRYSHRYVICDVLYEDIGSVDKIIPVDNIPPEALKTNRDAILNDDWYVRIRTEWYNKKGDNGTIRGGCEVNIPRGGDGLEKIPDSLVRRHLSKLQKKNKDNHHHHHHNKNNNNNYYDYHHHEHPFIGSRGSNTFTSKEIMMPPPPPHHHNRKLSTGVKDFILAVVNRNEISMTEDEMLNYIFGPQESLASQLDACSSGLATIVPRSEQEIVYVETTDDIGTYDFNTMFLNLAGPDPDLRSDNNLRDAYGIANNQPLSSIADHIMFIIPDAIAGGNNFATGWAANPGFYLGIKEMWLPSAQNNLHELGHNFGLEHGFEDGAEYMDRTTVMGASGYITNICFNGYHFQRMDWYQDRNFTLIPTDLPANGYLVDLAFYGHYEKTNANQPVFIQLLGFTDNYITLNRQAGINSEVIEYGDEVIIVQDRDPDPGTELVGHLPMREVEEGGWQTFFGDAKNVVVRLCGFTPETDDSPDFVTLAISTQWENACGLATRIGETNEPVTTPVPVPPTAVPTPAEDNDLVTIYVAITYDNNPEETGWVLRSGPAIIFESPPGTVSIASERIVTPIEVPQGEYTFEITDGGGDGICCSDGLGKVEIYQEVYVGIMNINNDGKLYIGFSSGRFGAGATINLETWNWPQ